MRQAEKDARRPYQDPVTPDFRKHVNIWADLERLRPMGDCVLVRMMPEPEMHANLIVIPETVRLKGNNLPRIGDVVAVGLGDRLFFWLCQDCTPPDDMLSGGVISTWRAPKECPNCGSHNQEIDFIGRHPIHVKPGDKVLFWRVPANQHIINQEVFQFVREEQHILAVLDKEGPDASTN